MKSAKLKNTIYPHKCFIRCSAVRKPQTSIIAKSKPILEMPKSKTEVSATSVVQILVPKDMVGVIIGRGGGKIRAIKEESRCKITFAAEANQEDQRPCSFIGTKENTEVARRLIERIISMPITLL